MHATQYSSDGISNRTTKLVAFNVLKRVEKNEVLDGVPRNSVLAIIYEYINVHITYGLPEALQLANDYGVSVEVVDIIRQYVSDEMVRINL